MQVPELYHQSRKGAYFGLRPFIIFFLDGIYQSAVLFFFFCYTYQMTTPRNDGYDINLYEWTTGMAIASVLVANLFVGLNTRAWNWFVVVGIWAGTVVMFCFAPIYAAFSSTYSYGNNDFLYPSIQFWVLGFLTLFLCLLPRLSVQVHPPVVLPNGRRHPAHCGQEGQRSRFHTRSCYPARPRRRCGLLGDCGSI